MRIRSYLQNHNHYVNLNKTEHTEVKKDSVEWKAIMQAESLLNSKEDIECPKHMAIVALNKLANMWNRGDKIKQKTKIKLYTSLVRFIILIHLWQQKQRERLDSFHRRQVRSSRHPIPKIKFQTQHYIRKPSLSLKYNLKSPQNENFRVKTKLDLVQLHTIAQNQQT